MLGIIGCHSIDEMGVDWVLVGDEGYWRKEYIRELGKKFGRAELVMR